MSDPVRAVSRRRLGATIGHAGPDTLQARRGDVTRFSATGTRAAITRWHADRTGRYGAGVGAEVRLRLR
ncbi:MAG TPA: hypothetical protein VGN37_15810 [Actinocatenispora sp.]